MQKTYSYQDKEINTHLICFPYRIVSYLNIFKILRNWKIYKHTHLIFNAASAVNRLAGSTVSKPATRSLQGWSICPHNLSLNEYVPDLISLYISDNNNNNNRHNNSDNILTNFAMIYPKIWLIDLCMHVYVYVCVYVHQYPILFDGQMAGDLQSKWKWSLQWTTCPQQHLYTYIQTDR